MSKAKLYKCPYCDSKFDKSELIDHISDKHDDLIPKNYSAFRVAYDNINHLTGDLKKKCIICNKTVNWDEHKGKYNITCNSKHCKEVYIDSLIKSKNINPQFKTSKGQEELLANRKISGTYKFSDGMEKTYTGSYEKKCLEFMDKILHLNSEDLMSPGVTLEYEYDGKKLMYISDFYYIPYNLIIEVKDGGDNPNRKSMIEYRNKTTAKEKYIINNTNYNYIRLTDNDLSQLLAVFMELKMKYLDNSTERIIRIND